MNRVFGYEPIDDPFVSHLTRSQKRSAVVRSIIRQIDQLPEVMESCQSLFSVMFSNPISIDYEGCGFSYRPDQISAEYVTFCKNYYKWKITRGVVPWKVLYDEFGFGHPFVPDTSDGDIEVSALGLGINTGSSSHLLRENGKYTYTQADFIPFQNDEYSFIECVGEFPTRNGELRCALSKVVDSYILYKKNCELSYTIESLKARPAALIEKRLPTNGDLIEEFKKDRTVYDYAQFGDLIPSEESRSAMEKAADYGVGGIFGVSGRGQREFSASEYYTSRVDLIRMGRFDQGVFAPLSNPSVDPNVSLSNLRNSVYSVLGISSSEDNYRRRNRDYRTASGGGVRSNRVKQEYVDSMRMEFEGVVKNVFLECFKNVMQIVSSEHDEYPELSDRIWTVLRDVTVHISPLNDSSASIDIVNLLYCAGGVKKEDHASILSRKLGFQVEPMEKSKVAHWFLNNKRKREEDIVDSSDEEFSDDEESIQPPPPHKENKPSNGLTSPAITNSEETRGDSEIEK